MEAAATAAGEVSGLPIMTRIVSQYRACHVLVLAATLLSPHAAARCEDLASVPPDSTFDKSVRPILQAHCCKCHGPETQKANLDLSRREGILRGGDSGVVIVGAEPDKSRLYDLVKSREMPPSGEGTPLTGDQIAIIRRWIEEGAGFGSEDQEDLPRVTQHDVLPILLLRCTVCHGSRVREGELDLRTTASILRGGKSGPAIVPGQPAESLLLKRIHAGEMPPRRRVVEVSIKPIEPAEIEILTRWIAGGAVESSVPPDVATSEPDPLVSAADRQFWSFHPPRRPVVPAVADSERVRNPIDAFVQEKLAEHGLPQAPEAEKLVLLRRLFFDLVGLPPTPDEVDEFLHDEFLHDNDEAYERLVERLLGSPRYGERWARYWLDLAGYADSNGVQHSDLIREHAWRYRDYVIRAFNADKPYDRFLLEQIAGDELADYEQASELTPELYDNLVATGFLRMTPDGTSANITNFVPDRLEIIADEINVLTSSLLGLTVRCARCHTHKTDPIPQRDYYRLAAIFKGAYDEHDWLKTTRKEDQRGPWGERLLDQAMPDELAAWQALETQINDGIQQLQATLAARTAERTRVELETRLAKLPAVLQDDLRKLLATPAEERDEIQHYLATKFEAELQVSPESLKQLDPDYKAAADESDKKIAELEGRRQTRPRIQALWDRGEPSPTYILRRGDYTKPGREVGPGVLSVLADPSTPLRVTPPWPGARQTGRRLAFARWLTQPDHPLTARVMVNRIWRHHFGAGLVRTLDNFGKTGEPPTHPELLDWLAREFVARGWSIKAMHRLMVTSATYRQASQTTDGQQERDPDNRWISHMPVRRLEAEPLRDSLLAVADRLDLTPFGKPDDVTVQPSGLVAAVRGERGNRRTIYLLQRRTQLLTLLEDFDLPPMAPNCIDRPVSTVAPQALHLMNDAGVHELAQAFAERVVRLARGDPARRVEIAWRLAYGRTPRDEEAALALASLTELTTVWSATLAASGTENVAARAADKALENLCHALFNSAEFVTID